MIPVVEHLYTSPIKVLGVAVLVHHSGTFFFLSFVFDWVKGSTKRTT
jgi:hypothetical protein